MMRTRINRWKIAGGGMAGLAVTGLLAALYWHPPAATPAGPDLAGGGIDAQRRIPPPFTREVIRHGRPAPVASAPAPPPVADSVARQPAAAVTEIPSAVPDTIPGEYVLAFFNARDRADFAALAARFGVQILDRTPLANALRIYAPDPDRLRALLGIAPVPVEFSPNLLVRAPPPPDDGPAATAPAQPYAGFGDKVLEWLGAPAPDPSAGSGVRVAVLDSGIPAGFAGRVIGRTDLTGEGLGNAHHGGAVAALIAGAGGLAPGVSLLDIQVLRANGQGDAFTLAKGIIEAVDRGAHVINLSIETRSDNPLLAAAVNYAYTRGVLLVAAVGNGGVTGISYPARYPQVLAVAAVDAIRRHLFFSNRGDEVDLSAPGIGVQIPGDAGDGPVYFSGTSAAAPFVTAAAALLLAADPALPPDAITALLKQYSHDTGAPGHDAATGAGVLDVGRLLARNETGIVDMVAIPPYMRFDAAGGVVRVDVFAQNQGTVELSQVEMIATVNGETKTLYFRNVGVGAVVAYPFMVSAASFGKDGVDAAVEVWPVGMEEATPHNNRIRSLILPDR